MALTANEATIPQTGKLISHSPALTRSGVQPLVRGLKQNLRERIQDLLSKLGKALEGDHEFHKYLGM